MTVLQTQEFSTWCRVTYDRYVPSFKLGRITLRKGYYKRETVDAIRVYPGGLGFHEHVPTKQVIQTLLWLGYKCLSNEAARELASSGIRSRRKGFLVIPLAGTTGEHGSCMFLIVENGVIMEANFALTPTTVETMGYSVIVAKS